MIVGIIIVVLIYYYIIKLIVKNINENNNKNKNKNYNYNKNVKNININDYNINYYRNNNYKINNNINNYKKYYTPRRYITTLNELNFYNILLEIAKELDLILFAQVSLYSIVETKSSLDYTTQTIYFNKINRKTIDFVLVNKLNCRIKLCIELDDPTHYRKKRKERDNFINELFKELEIPLLRYPSYPVYYKEPLKKKILENIKDTYYMN